MKTIFKPLLLILLSISVAHAFAQTDTTKEDGADTIATPKAHLRISLGFTNNSVFLGRTDTVTTSSFSPTLNYTFASGIYVSGGLDFIPNRKSNKLDGGNLELGYDHSFTDDFEGGISFTKMFYNSNSTEVSASLRSVATAYLDYDIAGIVTPTLTFSYNGNKSGINNDVLFNPSLSHDFEIEGIFCDSDFILISPQAGLNAGSQNFYSGYLEQRKRLTKKGTAAQTALFNSYYDALDSFKLLDYEITVPIVYKSGHFRFSFTPTYAFAQDTLPYSTAFEKLETNEIQAQFTT